MDLTDISKIHITPIPGNFLSSSHSPFDISSISLSPLLAFSLYVCSAIHFQSAKMFKHEVGGAFAPFQWQKHHQAGL